ncbi:histone-like nucleoid-structuring protein, MvaT/MvaU family [Halomonas heilongjiangensis]|uniref:MvaT DNA-binding domain-containing protein n=1 Tax=Halomonas heilongjiangensis TaxID=1387883 RepID=A0A2N7TU92_9GAMM|nr:histone-like nucleoid-structuring protein, MvaT/MvaU family [Halomonas heilongjiangensis]PMR71747.1 hypothetical protein C1H66_01550 [Halomonas heilongjiangensis]PXX89970.1 hypothetical protein CR158_10325 [Halomonas heilongjiangensis]
MSERLKQYYKANLEILEAQRRLAELEQDSEIKRELEFELRLVSIVERYRKSYDDAISILEMRRRGFANVVDAIRDEEKVKTYVNPFTNETVRAKRKTKFPIKQWVEEYGHDVVDSWVVDEAC